MILQALDGYYRRVAAKDPEFPRFGYGAAPISFAVILDLNGHIVDVSDLRQLYRGRNRSLELVVPKDFEDRTAGDARPRAFWDKPEYIFGVSQQPERALRRFRNFKARHESILADSSDEGLNALLNYLSDWDVSRGIPSRIANANDPEVNVCFMLSGHDGFIHDRPAARLAWELSLQTPSGSTSQCLVTGVQSPIARLHPLIKNIARPGQSTPKLVAFDKDSDAYASYDKLEGENASISEAAAFAYTTALNSLLSRTVGRTERGAPIYRNRVQIGDATTVFWAEADDAAQADAAEALASGFFNPLEAVDDGAPDLETDQTAAAKVRGILRTMADGRPIAEAAPDLAATTRFYVLGLSPNAARLSVRFWHATTLGDLASAFQQHWRDLDIEPRPWRTAPAIWRLLVQTAPQGKTENVPPHLAGEVMRAILGRTRYPRTLVTSVLMRIRADGDLNGIRAAILKACLIRQKEVVPVALDRANTNAGYRLGRLFAVLESAQKAALPGLNATIRDRYFAAASATPASVFPVLIRNANHHLGNLRKGDKGGLAVWLEREIGEVVDGLGTRFPGTLRIEEQGQFAIGYYHQRFAKGAGKPAEIADDSITPDATEQ